jgi:hypothetical protein
MNKEKQGDISAYSANYEVALEILGQYKQPDELDTEDTELIEMILDPKNKSFLGVN